MTDHNGSNTAHIPLSSREEQVEQANNLEELITILSEAYDITPLDVQRLPIGQATLNYKVVCSKQNVFVKRYLPGTDLAAEHAAINLSLIAGKAGVPVAQLFPSHAGKWITTHGETTISVWKYVDGRTITTHLNEPQFQATGAALGRIHRQFASLVEGRGIQRLPQAWLAVDVAKTEQKIDQLLDIIATQSVMDEFDSIAQESLRERRAMLPSVSPLLNGIPNLTSQILHGDYSALNLLFTDTAVAAVLDFRPPERFLMAYEIGRIAFYPSFVVYNADWLSASCTFMRGYLTENPKVMRDDIVYSARVWLVQLLTSLYGVKDHYLKPGLLQDGLDAFWQLRHQAARLLLGHVHEIEAMLGSISSL